MGKSLNLVTASDLSTCSEQVILDIAPFLYNLDEDQIVIVPDKFSLIVEKLIFDKLKINSTLNIRVMGINRFVTILLNENKVDVNTISSNQELILLGKAILSQSKNFKYFTNALNDLSFVSQIKNTISQLKTSGISPCDMQSLIELNDKFHDIYLIYKNYEEIQKNGEIDIADFLDLMPMYPKSKIIQSSRFYFAFFDSFTKQGLNIVSTLLENSKSVEIAVVNPDSEQKNKFIYDNTLINNLIDLAKEKSIPVNVEKVNSANYISNIMSKNLFLSKPQTCQVNQFIEFCECFNNEKEIEYIAKKIKTEVLNGKRYKDIVVACSDLNSKSHDFIRIFKDFDIPCFIDCDYTILNSVLAKFIISVINFNISQEKTEYFKQILSLPFVDKIVDNKSEIFGFINKYKDTENIFNMEFFACENDKNVYLNLQKIYSLLTFKNLTQNKEISGLKFVEYVKQILANFCCQEVCLEMTNYYKEKGDFVNFQINKSIYDKLCSILNSFCEETSNDYFLIGDFLKLFENVLEGNKLKTVPLGVDQVYVADCDKSFFEQNKIMFLCGCNGDVMPSYIKDVGLICDKDIHNISKFVKIEPSIRIINKRKRLAICSVLTIPHLRCYVSWSKYDNDGKVRQKSSFVDNLRKIFASEQNLQEVKTYGFSNRIDVSNSTYQDFAEFINNKNNATKLMLSYIQSPTNIEAVYYNSLYSILNQDNKISFADNINATNKIENISCANQLFFKQNKFSVSQIEAFAKCPFAHFAQYGLKLKEQKPVALDSALIGTIEHFVFEQFFKKYNKTDVDVNEKIEEIFRGMKNDDKFSYFLNNKNFKVFVQALKKECKKQIVAMIGEQNKSNFKIYSYEKRLRLDNYVTIVANGQKIALTGIVDRIDKCGNKAIIIDYKTGKVERDIHNIIYGNKLQILIYADAVEQALNVDCVGALYMPISSKKTKELQKLFDGYIEADIDVLQSFDSEIMLNLTSNLINVKLKKEKDNSISICSSKNSSAIDTNTFKNLISYSKNLVQLNVNKINEGYVSCSPLFTKDSKSCDYCPFGPLCRFDEMSGNCGREKNTNVKILEKVDDKN